MSVMLLRVYSKKHDSPDALGLEKVMFLTPAETALFPTGLLKFLAASSCRSLNSLFLICFASTTQPESRITTNRTESIVEDTRLRETLVIAKEVIKKQTWGEWENRD
jgi:hypothetical protein